MMSLRAVQRLRSTLGALIGATATIVFVMVGTSMALRLMQPVGTVLIVGDLTPEQCTSISRIVEPFSSGGLLRLDKKALRAAVSEIGWTREVRVRRVWPDRLELTVEREIPVAQWGNDQLLNSRGKIITDDDMGDASQLPLLRGPDGSVSLVMERYFVAREMASRLGLRVKELTLDSVNGWKIVFDSGMELVLGHDDSIARMQRFERLYLERLHSEAEDIVRVDARYTNGVAVTRDADARSHANLVAEAKPRDILRKSGTLDGG
ncbi:MAG: cell division protein FtsQ/DivIB [Gammaproteobacteria bacterium]|nr:cell division protein FtsQ/DivIB [Gammaproteobacteria bacterium]